jgi:uncharacterized protein
VSAPRGRDAAGRPVPGDSPDAVEPVPEHALPPDEALALARDLLARGRPFFAHDVLEAAWKAAPTPERRFWQGLAQVCVGLTHLQRGNPVGGARLLRRGAERLDEHLAGGGSTTHGVDVRRVATAARARAAAVDAGREGEPVELWPLPPG